MFRLWICLMSHVLCRIYVCGNLLFFSSFDVYWNSNHRKTYQISFEQPKTMKQLQQYNCAVFFFHFFFLVLNICLILEFCWVYTNYTSQFATDVNYISYAPTSLISYFLLVFIKSIIWVFIIRRQWLTLNLCMYCVTCAVLNFTFFPLI